MNDEIVELIKELVSFKTISDQPEELKKCIDFIESYFDGCDVVLKRYENKGKPSLIVLLEETKQPELFLVAHCDVVPGNDEQFEPSVKEGKLYGRGSIDNKGSAAIIMQLMKHYSQQEKKPSIGLMFTTDEEIGGVNGTKYLIEKEGYSAKFAVVLDGGHDFNIVTKEKAALHVKVIAKGRSSHGSRPWKGENAINKLIDFYANLKKQFPETTKEERWKQTINLGKIEGGVVANKVPDRAEILLDMRFITNEDKNNMLEMIKSSGFEYEVTTDADVLDTDTENKYLHTLKQSVEKVTGKQINFTKEHGATDARYFSSKDIPTGLLLPLGGGVHGEDEWVDVESLMTIYNVLKEFIETNIKKS